MSYNTASYVPSLRIGATVDRIWATLPFGNLNQDFFRGAIRW
jgi:hypothetical protein